MDNQPHNDAVVPSPPAHTRFKKGRSGNPNGRPKGTKNPATCLSFTRISRQPRWLVAWMHLCLALAPMFTGREEEAKELPLRYRGQTLGQGKGKRKTTWKAIVLKTFDQFRNERYSHPMMKEMERRFDSISKGNSLVA